MKWSWRLSIALLGLLGPALPAAAGTMQATLGLEYDDHPFDDPTSRRSGWVNRLYLSWAGTLLDHPRATLRMGHQWGVKRFWKAGETAGSAGDVVASQLDLGGTVRLKPRFAMHWGSELKLKSVERLSSEDGYLRAGVRLGLTAQWEAGFSGWANYGCGWDDARSPGQGNLALHELDGGIHWARSRRLSGQFGVRGGRLDFDRQAWKVDAAGNWSAVAQDQRDRRIEWTIGAQYYRGMLIQAGYAWIGNWSNSVGYQYRAHRIHLTLARHLPGALDGQFFFISQFRRYPEELPSLVPGAEGMRQEYEQLLGSLKLARQVSEGCDISLQCRYLRNHNRLGDGFFGKKIYSLSIDRVL